MTSKLHFIDFKPAVTTKKFWTGNEFEPTTVVLERANDWIRSNYNREIINVETLLLPMTDVNAKNTSAQRINMHSGFVYMLQVIRVWYK